jgi:lipid-A-disaccharide synthase
MSTNLTDLFIIAGEPSADLHGAKLIEELLRLHPNLQIAAIAGPRMRQLPIQTQFLMENLQVMGFVDVIAALPRIVRQFFAIRRKILELKPKAVVFIDYPGFNLRLAASLRKKKFRGRLIHYICPTVWAWGKKRIHRMEKTLDLLLVLFPFEKKCFASTPLRVEYVGHPLASQILSFPRKDEPILALFPGSRETEIVRNFPIQLAAAKKILGKDPGLKIAVSIAASEHEPLIRTLAKDAPVHFYSSKKTYELMRSAKLAIATSGTVTLELALHKVPSVVNFAIRPIDLFLAQKIFRINLPFYCIVNIILSKSVFPELFGPNLSEKNLDDWTAKLWFDDMTRAKISAGCEELRQVLGSQDASREAARLMSLDF